MKVFIFLILLMSTASIPCRQGLELQFFNPQNQLVCRIDQDDFEIWPEPEYLALRIERQKAKEISQLGSRLTYGVCRIINRRGDSFSIKILDADRAHKSEKCIYLWSTQDGLVMLAGVFVIGNASLDECKDEVDKLASFLNAD